MGSGKQNERYLIEFFVNFVLDFRVMQHLKEDVKQRARRRLHSGKEQVHHHVLDRRESDFRLERRSRILARLDLDEHHVEKVSNVVSVQSLTVSLDNRLDDLQNAVDC